ncbi:pyrimidine-ribonucleotide metabolism [Rhodopirellula islandica]|uniref:Pyrimidine-ribonucleotide metabolism n=1 Tax=Rhodopirellula islandica TaxID=595434 RepID=A0A0J1BGS4_RHOIS|nr:cytidylate kinase-like family protein [Rhodopirellula islandica]KLU05757.1 pyrimidine-ribonucleotide metabolism [Rhodopirellula islandica]
MSVRVPAIERRADERVLKWIHAEHNQDEASQADTSKRLGPFITISREAGAGGSELAGLVAEKLHWDLLDNEIVDFMEQHYGTPRCLIQRVDEKHENWLSEILTSRIGGLGFSESTYTHRVSKLVLLAASHGNVVIVGRGAKYLLPPEQGLSVRVVAPLNSRIQRVMSQHDLSEKEARHWVANKDRQRQNYIRGHFHQDESDPHLYDLVLNVGIVSLEEAAEIVVDSARRLIEKFAKQGGC